MLARASVRSSRDVASVVRESVRGLRRETFFALLLDARRRILSLRVVSQGSADAAIVHPREVFSPAVREGASAVVVAHNHPSGDPTPSAEDRDGELLGIEMLDHVVVGDGRCFSFAEEQFLSIA